MTKLNFITIYLISISIDVGSIVGRVPVHFLTWQQKFEGPNRPEILGEGSAGVGDNRLGYGSELEEQAALI